MTANWNDHAEGWDDNADVQRYSELAFVSLVTEVEIRTTGWKSKRILDFGCGTGLMAERVAPFVREVVAIDTSEKMIAVLDAKGIANVVAMHGNVLDADFQRAHAWQSSFDLIYASSVCGFLSDYEGAVKSLVGLLKPSGTFIQWDWQATDDDDVGMTEMRIRNALTSARLRSVRAKPAFDIEADGMSLPVLLGVGVV
ncbi:class I SAM-dependent DNA methyltransferase [Sulfitobacter sp. MF3-043]|uniref:class I SAM-dependent DNA methyltransferase n=1 Tax=Sulfitobacter sediminivivens TaxID=3252902 RepID=UPI0036DF3FD5